jgi:hypothetical protein
MPRKKKPKQKVYFEYFIEIEDWDWSFSFGVEYPKWSDLAYSDFRHLHIDGRLLYPTNFKTDRAHLTLLPKHDCHLIKREGDVPRCVASLNVHNGILEGLLTMPCDALGPVITALVAKRIRLVVINATKLRGRQALANYFSLEYSRDPDDLPEGVQLSF